MERSPPVPRLKFDIGSPRLSEGSLLREGHHALQHRIEGPQASQIQFGQLDGSYLTGSQ